MGFPINNFRPPAAPAAPNSYGDHGFTKIDNGARPMLPNRPVNVGRFAYNPRSAGTEGRFVPRDWARLPFRERLPQLRQQVHAFGNYVHSCELGQRNPPPARSAYGAIDTFIQMAGDLRDAFAKMQAQRQTSTPVPQAGSTDVAQQIASLFKAIAEIKQALDVLASRTPAATQPATQPIPPTVVPATDSTPVSPPTVPVPAPVNPTTTPVTTSADQTPSTQTPDSQTSPPTVTVPGAGQTPTPTQPQVIS